MPPSPWPRPGGAVGRVDVGEVDLALEARAHRPDLDLDRRLQLGVGELLQALAAGDGNFERLGIVERAPTRSPCPRAARTRPTSSRPSCTPAQRRGRKHTTSLARQSQTLHPLLPRLRCPLHQATLSGDECPIFSGRVSDNPTDPAYCDRKPFSIRRPRMGPPAQVTEVARFRKKGTPADADLPSDSTGCARPRMARRRRRQRDHICGLR